MILIAEDDRIQSTKLKFKLKQLGYDEVLVASNGFEALEICTEHAITLVFCDIRMPEMDGITLLSKLGEYANMSVIILSALEDDVLELCYNMCSLASFHFVDVLRKPYSEEQLHSVLEVYQRKRTEKQSQFTPIQLSSEDIEHAFNADLLFNYYQPQFDFQTGAMVGVEALVRYEHPHYGLLGPVHFLPVIEQYGLMDRLFIVVLEKSISAIASLKSNLRLSVNITQSNLEQSISETVLALCNEYQFEPSQLVLELTEGEVYNSTTTSLANLARLRMHGVGLSIDDFGTGYASLSQLSKLPFTELKIDKSFVQDLSTNYKNQQLTNMCLLLAQSLGLHCVVEGVENEEVWQYLRHLKVDTCQGYYSAMPMSIGELAEMYSKNHSQRLNRQSLNDGVHCLLIDNQSISAYAIQKLMQKEQGVSRTTLTFEFEQALKTLRDLPINLVVVGYKSNAQQRDSLSKKIRMHGYSGKIVFLYEYSDTEVNVEVDNSNTSCILKAATLAETVKNIIHQTEINDNNDHDDSYYRELLSERELTVAQLLIQGLTNKQIANQLDISQKTVSTYKTRILQKLGINSAIELVRFIKIN